MSANNQTLIVEHKGKFYVFTNVMAESWCDDDGEHVNELSIKKAKGVFETRDEAYSEALQLDLDDDMENSEYGVQFNRLCKDDAKVILIP